jgi:NAD(P)-dependent dehydrogenase (short-subunit alcohol dehydrogenase family)
VAYADEKELTLAGLVCNAGLIGTHATRVNHMGHFALVLGLLASLERGVRRWGALGGGANVVVVSSVAHVQGALSMRDDHGNIDPVWRDADGAAKGDWAVYSESKAANALFSQGMARRLRESGVRTVSYHPGVMLTGLWRAKGENEGLDRLTLCRWMASLVVKHPRISGAGLASLAVPRSGVRCLLPRRGHPSGCGATLARMGQRCLCGDSGGYYQQCLCCCLIPVRAWPQIYSVGLQRTLWESSSQGLREECPELAEKVAARYPGLLSGPLKEEVIQKQPGARTEASSIQPGPPGRLLISPAPVCTEWLSCLPWCACVACLC